jgi:hypothetical protein
MSGSNYNTIVFFHSLKFYHNFRKRKINWLDYLANDKKKPQPSCRPSDSEAGQTDFVI